MGIFFGGLDLEDNDGNYMIVGMPSSGKSLSLQAMMSTTVPMVLTKPNHRLIVFDVKQDQISALYGIVRHVMRQSGRGEEETQRVLDERICITNPFDERCRAWDCAKDVTGEDTAYQIASILIPQEQGQNRYFTDAARDLLCGIIKIFIALGVTDWGLADITIPSTDERALRHLLSHTEDGRTLLAAHLKPGTTGDNVFSTLRSRMMPFRSIAALWRINEAKGRKFSLTDFMNDNQILVLGNNQSAIAPLRAINQVLFQRMSELLLDKPENRGGMPRSRTWIYLDEVRKLGRLEGLSDVMTNGRSKGVIVILGFQDIDGLIEAYGREVAGELTSMCATVGMLKLSGVSSPKWASDFFGEQEVIDAVRNRSNSIGVDQSSSSSGLSEQIRTRPVVLGSEFRSLPFPSRELGYLAGYFSTAHVANSKPYYAEIPWDDLMSRIYPRAEPETDFVRWTDERAKDLRPWNAEDCERLRLRPMESGNGSPRPERDEPSPFENDNSDGERGFVVP